MKIEEEVRVLFRLLDYGQAREHRDELVRYALRLGISKMSVHKMSGISRTTIDRILAGQS
jgi:hypothetical protein